MKRDEVLAILAAHREHLQEIGVKSLSLFGSVARDEARQDSVERRGNYFKRSRVRIVI